MNKTYILIDTVSIQKYIFASNRLRMNIGASYIVGHKLFSEKRLKDCKIIYKGGGNAMLEFSSDGEAIKFIENYSLDILLNFPGLKLAYGKHEGDIDELKGEEFKNFMQEIHKDLRKCKFDNFNQVTPFQPGIVSVCRYTGEAASVFDSIDKRYLSYSAKARNDTSDTANKELQIGLSGEYKSKFDFPAKLEDLGQQEGKGYIAIVHIDGNGVGDMFKQCENKAQLQGLSEAVNIIVKGVYGKLLDEVCMYNYDDLGLKLKEEDGKLLLPFRPIILGGDDITFVCEGSLGIYLAQRFLNLYEMKSINFKDKKIILKASAGITIVKTKFPFFKAYELAEELLSNAKNQVRNKKNEDGIYPTVLSYKIQSTGNSDNVESNVLLFEDLEKLIVIISYFKDEANLWTQSKIMQLRDVLDIKMKAKEGNCPEYNYFKAHAEMRGLSLPVGASDDELICAIELMEFYPLNPKTQVNHA
jgi:hypothetical protein